MKIIVDVFGGDNAPLAILEGAAQAKQELGCEMVLCGDEAVIRKTAQENKIDLAGMEFLNAPDVISMEDDPSDVVRAKKDCSMAAGLRLLAQGGGDAFVSAGSTGALLVGATLLVKRIKGVKRCALAPILPSDKGCFMLIDGGANVECRPEMLAQFGVMGSVYMEKVMGIDSPRVGLANVGTEPTKGGELQKAAFGLLSSAPVNFIGNVEARDLPWGGCDVLVADGFTGNTILKLTEGVAGWMFGSLKTMFKSGLRGKLAAMLMMPKLKEFKKKMDTDEYGGAPLLGTLKPVFKAHGSSNAKAFKNAVRLAAEFARTDVIGTMTENLRGQEQAE